MPVIGHAFAGLATALQFEPAAAGETRQPAPLARAWWAPAVVATSYFPDIVTQVGGVLGAPHANAYGHSFAVGALAGVGLGIAWSRSTGTSLTRGIAIATGSIFGHDVLDILQSTDLAPYWPWSGRIVRTGVLGLSARIASEGLVATLLFSVFLAWRMVSGRSLGSLTSHSSARSPVVRWAPHVVMGAILIAALGTHTLRGSNERQLNTARRLLDSGKYVEALQAADLADGWPRGNRPGRIDMIRAQAHHRLGHFQLAETYYLRAHEEDPNNFWALADLAEYYASSDRPLVERRRLSQIYAAELRDRFGQHRSLPGVLTGIERELMRAAQTE
jgi:hypothetical protein